MTGRELGRRLRAHGFIAAWNGAPGLGALFCTGPDAGTFLQAQLTSDVLALRSGEGQLSARVDRRGRLRAWFSLHRLPERGQAHPLYLLLLPADQVDALRDELLGAAVAEDIRIDDVGADLAGVLREGPDVATGEPLSVTTAEDPPGAWCIARSFTGDPGELLLWFGDAAEQDACLETRRGAAVQLDAEPAADAAWRSLQIEAGRPELGRDLEPGSHILNQTGLTDETVCWTKGCFLGQEILARVRTYGSPPESLRCLVFDGRDVLDAPSPGAPLLSSDSDALGTWAGAGWSPTREAPVALAFLRRDWSTPGRRLDLSDGVVAEVVLPPLYSAADAETRARHLYEQAVSQFSAGEDETAVALLENALVLCPDYGDALEALGVILGRLQRYDEAIAVFERLERMAPDEPMVHVNLSLYHMKRGDTEEAERQKTLATLKRFGAGAAAAAVDRTALEAEARRKLALFDEVLAFDPDDPLALMGSGEALTALGEIEAAETRLARARAGQPDNSALHLRHGRVLETLERPDEAAAVYAAGVAVAARRGDLQPLREMEHRLLVLRAAERPTD